MVIVKNTLPAGVHVLIDEMQYIFAVENTYKCKCLFGLWTLLGELIVASTADNLCKYFYIRPLMVLDLRRLVKILCFFKRILT